METPTAVPRFIRRSATLGAALATLALIGCGGSSVQVAEVDGVVLIGGKPGHKVYVQFLPEASGETRPPSSMAETDAEGRFTLLLMDGPAGSDRPGAVVGSHRVVLRDLQLAESVTGAGLPIRLSPNYTLPGSTPLVQEVKEGQQTIEIQVPYYARPR